MKPIDPDFYDREYFTDGSKSNYMPYGPGGWANDIADMVAELEPASVLDVGCAYGYVVERLAKRGIEAYGFDISEFAVAQADSERVWTGSADDENVYREVDLILATELPEHLTPEQSDAFMRHAYRFGKRALMLIAMYEDGQTVDMSHEKDLSHINIQPVSWWKEHAEAAGWKVGSAVAMNADRRSVKMNWNGRWLYLEKE